MQGMLDPSSPSLFFSDFCQFLVFTFYLGFRNFLNLKKCWIGEYIERLQVEGFIELSTLEKLGSDIDTLTVGDAELKVDFIQIDARFWIFLYLFYLLTTLTFLKSYLISTLFKPKFCCSEIFMQIWLHIYLRFGGQEKYDMLTWLPNVLPLEANAFMLFSVYNMPSSSIFICC
jgi:hypothetical protein